MSHPHNNKSGQAMLFLIMVLVVGTFVVVWNFDLHRAVVQKMKVRDAGDAAALASARWHAITLNTLGELNLIQAAVLTDYVNGDIYPQEAADEMISLRNMRLRLEINGPIVAFAAAQQAALNNGAYASARYQRWLQYWDFYWLGDSSMSDEARAFYQSILDNGIAVKALFPYGDSDDYHPLFDRDFYEAISLAKHQNMWCMFYLYPEFGDILRSYSSPESSWDELPDTWGNPPYQSLSVREWFGAIGWTNMADFSQSGRLEEFQDAVDWYGQQNGNIADIDAGNIQGVAHIYEYGFGPALTYVTWAKYTGSSWTRSWNDYIDDNELPYRSAVKDEYDYLGGQSVFRLTSDFRGLPPRSYYRSMEWTSAAKVMGHLPGGQDPAYFGLILPAFDNARLIPVPRSADRVYPSKLNDYLDQGISAFDEDGDGKSDTGNWLQQMLIYFDDPDFRQSGIDWLEEHGDECAQAGFTPSNSNTTKDKGPVFAH